VGGERGSWGMGRRREWSCEVDCVQAEDGEIMRVLLVGERIEPWGGSGQSVGKRHVRVHMFHIGLREPTLALVD
jgi:hypothetical protein